MKIVVNPVLIKGSYRVFRVYRGGGWFSAAGYCQSAFRLRDEPTYRYFYYGFRIVMIKGVKR